MIYEYGRLSGDGANCQLETTAGKFAVKVDSVFAALEALSGDGWELFQIVPNSPGTPHFYLRRPAQ